jgi:D-glycero-alpha-D-manno-heptose-7-phosphate kinase
MEIHHHGDLPARSGLGSSSSFTVGLLNALHAFKGHMRTDRELAKEAIHVEQDVLMEKVGCQDQIWAAYGGFNRIEFLRDGGFNVAPIVISPERRAELVGSIMMFFTGFSRFSSDFAHEQLKNLSNRRSQLNDIRAIVDRAFDILRDNNMPLRDLGEMMHDSWRLKRELADTVSNSQIDEIYEAGRAAGAIGGKLLGAGGGGFMVFFVEPDKREKLRERFKHLIQVSVDIESEGSKIVVYQPDGI